MVEKTHELPLWRCSSEGDVKRMWDHFTIDRKFPDFFRTPLAMLPEDGDRMSNSQTVTIEQPSKRPCCFLSEEIRESNVTGIPKGTLERCAHPNHRTLILLRGAIIEVISKLKGAVDKSRSCDSDIIVHPVPAEQRLVDLENAIITHLGSLELALKGLKVLSAASNSGEMTGGFAPPPVTTTPTVSPSTPEVKTPGLITPTPK